VIYEDATGSHTDSYCAPISSAQPVGFRGDYNDFKVDNWVATPEPFKIPSRRARWKARWSTRASPSINSSPTCECYRRVMKWQAS